MTKIDQLAQGKKLYIDEMLTGRNAADVVGISYTHFYRWIRKYGWKEERERKIQGIGAINDFIKSLQSSHPALSEQFRMYADEYFKTKNQ